MKTIPLLPEKDSKKISEINSLIYKLQYQITDYEHKINNIYEKNNLNRREVE